MAFARILLGFLIVTLFLALWHDIERRLRGQPGPALAAAGRSLPASGLESLLLTLFAGLWFGSLGSGGATMLFLVLGALMEIPPRLWHRTGDGFAWKPIAGGMLRVVLAGALLARIMG